MSSAIEALKNVGADIEDIDIIGLAKAQEKGMKYAGIRESKSFERVYKKDASEPRVLSPTSAAVNLLARVRDESHRFAITYHRKLRSKKGIASPLDDIPGVGKEKEDATAETFRKLQGDTGGGYRHPVRHARPAEKDGRGDIQYAEKS